MKYFKKLKKYKGSNVELTIEPNLKAYSYGWWLFLVRYKGLVIFNNYNYSPTTIRHQYKTQNVLDDLKIKIDITLNHTDLSLDNVEEAIRSEIENIELVNEGFVDLIKNPRTQKAKNEERKKEIERNKTQIENLKQVLLR
jgi:hypothetical protein